MQSNFKNDITQPVIFNTPKGLDLSELFPTYSEEKLDKVRYIIHQCNYYSNKSGYNLDLTNHSWFLSLTRNNIAYIKKVLMEASVIKLSIKGAKGIKSDHFKMVQPFNYLNESSINKHFFYLNDKNCPLWIQRYVADDSACRNAETTNWVKRPADWQPSTVQPLAEISLTVDAKDAYIKLLEAALTANNIALPILDSIPAPQKDVKMPAGHDVTDLTPVTSKVEKVNQFLANIKADLAKGSTAEDKPELAKVLTPVVQPVLAKGSTPDTKPDLNMHVVHSEPSADIILIEIGQGFGDYVLDNYSKLLDEITVLSQKDIFSLNRAMIRALKSDVAETKTLDLRGKKMDFVINPVSRIILFLGAESMALMA